MLTFSNFLLHQMCKFQTQFSCFISSVLNNSILCPDAVEHFRLRMLLLDELDIDKKTENSMKDVKFLYLFGRTDRQKEEWFYRIQRSINVALARHNKKLKTAQSKLSEQVSPSVVESIIAIKGRSVGAYQFNEICCVPR